MVNNTLADLSSMRTPKFSSWCTYDSARCNKAPISSGGLLGRPNDH